ncbi:hypothetical protein QN397_23710 [Variovorax sp. RTB1]|uniref:hypothetical protein n=1 Tax=Variovorax sp. RTB1 TaxID=3048631 RepID=UPI002B234C39|nr:hypothetical protein [Variovorax sp. RTB1]MEB0114290.1 hypothetical protein [Variovorax sp. RTB1]
MMIDQLQNLKESLARLEKLHPGPDSPFMTGLRQQIANFGKNKPSHSQFQMGMRSGPSTASATPKSKHPSETPETAEKPWTTEQGVQLVERRATERRAKEAAARSASISASSHETP